MVVSAKAGECPASLQLTLLSIEGQDVFQIKQSSLAGMHLRLYCEQRSAAAGTERFEAGIILSAISYKYLTEEEERKRERGRGGIEEEAWRRTGRGGGAVV